MKKFFIMIMTMVISIAMLTGCSSNVFTEKTVTTKSMCITSWAFDTDSDYRWYQENVWDNDKMSDEEKDAIYFEMTGRSIYVEES